MTTKILIFMGTCCNRSTTDPIVQFIKERLPKAEITRLCWTDLKDKCDITNYFDSKTWTKINLNVKFDIVLGHSAGNFPLTLVKSKIYIAINPPYMSSGNYFFGGFKIKVPKGIYICRASNDWLVPNNAKVKYYRLLNYEGDHSTMPIAQITSIMSNRGY